MTTSVNIFPDLQAVMMQGIGTLVLAGMVVIFFYIVFILIKLPKKIVTLENKVEIIDETLRKIEDSIDKNKE